MNGIQFICSTYIVSAGFLLVWYKQHGNDASETASMLGITFEPFKSFHQVFSILMLLPVINSVCAIEIIKGLLNNQEK